MHGPIVLGIVGGLLGALFIQVNKFMSKLRKKIKKSVILRVIDTILFSCVTMSVCFFLSEYFGSCVKKRNEKIINAKSIDPDY